EGPRRAELPARRQVPFADRERAVARVAQDARQRRGRAGDGAVVAREPDRDVGEEAHADGVVIAPREQAGACGRAERRDVEAVVAETAGGQRVDVRGRDVGTEAAEL